MSKSYRNVLFIVTDQQRFDTLGCNDQPVARTPHLDQLASTGLNFRNHFVANPVSSPSRGSIMTGLHITEHGLWANGCELPRHHTTIPQAMAARGFQTAHFGKLHLEPIIRRTKPHAPYGFETCEVAEGDQQLIDDAYFQWLRSNHPDEFVRYLAETYEHQHAKAYTSSLPEELHLSTWVTNRAVDWLTHRRRDEQPFLLSVGYFDPHHAFNPCEPYASMFWDVDVPAPLYEEDELANKPEHYQAAARGIHDLVHDAGKIRAIRQSYHAMCAHLDVCVGRLLRTLSEQGLAEDTAVIFTSDHGEMLGEHGMLWKGPWMLDDLLKVPMIVNVPGRPIAPEGGRTIESLSSSIDLISTIQAIAGIDPADQVRGSGRPILDADFAVDPEGRRESVRAEWEHFRDGPSASLRCIRTETHKYVYYGRSEERELYDLSSDPRELHNLADLPDAAGLREQMHRQLCEAYLTYRPHQTHLGGW